MRMISKRVLAICLAAILLAPGLSVLAEETTETGDVCGVEIPQTVSGSDMNTEIENVDDQIMPLADGDIASGTDGNITWVIDADGKLTVNGTGDLSGDIGERGYNFAWHSYSSQIISAEIRVTGMTDASALFYNCSNMVSIDVSGFDTGNVTDMESMFAGCNSLSSLDVSGFDTGKVRNMGAMFANCSSLTTLDVSGFDTRNVTTMSGAVDIWREGNTTYLTLGGMFQGCSNLNSLDVSGFDTSNVTDMYSMFKGCSNLRSLDVSGFDTSNVTTMTAMFEECNNLSDLDVSGFNTGNVTTMAAMFRECNNLHNLNVSGFDTSNVTGMGAMFANCSSLTTLDVGGFNTGNVSVMYAMFGGCSNLSNLDVSGFDTGNVTTMEYMFGMCNNLTTLDVSGFDTSNVTIMSAMFEGCSNLSYLDVSGFNTGNVKLMYSMFAGCNSLTTLDVSGFDTSNVTNMGGMFAGCNSLTALNVSGFDTSNVTIMSGMFTDCSSLTSLSVCNFLTGNVTNMGGMFAGCSGLTNLDVDNFDTSNVVSMWDFITTTYNEGGYGGRWAGMFMGCSSLKHLNLSNFNTHNVIQMFWMFDGCSSLESLDLSNFDLSSIDTGKTFDSACEMFTGCSNLTLVNSPCNLTSIIVLPAIMGTTWHLPDGTEVTELPQGLDYSVTLTRSGTPTLPQITTTTPDLNMADVVRVKYVPYSYTVETNNTDPNNGVTFSIEEGRLADGLELYPTTGEIYGVPLETGSFPITVKATYSNPAYLPSYAELTLTVLDNTDANVGVATDAGYDITQPVVGFDTENTAGSGTQTLVSQGEYTQFRDVYIDGMKLTAGRDYTSEAGSTRITILNQTLSSGGEGTHTLGIEFRTAEGTLKRAAQNYVIGRSSGGNSNTGDNSNTVSLIDANPTDTLQYDFIIYTVEKGDSLWKIAAKFYGQGSSWRRIYEDNKLVIKTPSRLYKGQQLIIRLTTTTAAYVPETADSTSNSDVLEGTAYRIQPGDRLWTIARRAYGSGKLWTIIYEANRDVIIDPEHIRSGQTIRIPKREMAENR